MYLHTLCMIDQYDDADVSDNKIFSVMQWQWQCLTARGKARWKQNTTQHNTGGRGRWRGNAVLTVPASGGGGAGEKSERRSRSISYSMSLALAVTATSTRHDGRWGASEGVGGGGTRRLRSRRGRAGCLRMTVRLCHRLQRN